MSSSRLGRILASVDGRDVLLVVALGCLTVGMWLVSAALALTALGLVLLGFWVWPHVAVQPPQDRR